MQVLCDTVENQKQVYFYLGAESEASVWGYSALL